MSKRLLTAAALSLGLGTIAIAGSWPEFRGENNDGISAEKMLGTWPEGGPKVMWKKNIGAGLGSFAVAEGKAYFLAANGDNESCHAINTKDGSEIWTAPMGVTQKRRDGQGGNGPGSTPAVDSGKVYAYGSRLDFYCFDAATGKILWKHDIQADFQGQADAVRGIKTWGSTVSPIVDEDRVIIMGGGNGQTFMAFNKNTGEVIWKKDTEQLTHATPTVATIHGVKQIIFIVFSGLVSLDPKTGEALWKAPFDAGRAAAVGASPVVDGDTVYGSVGYGIGGSSFKISKDGDKFSAKQLWYTKGQSLNQWSTPVVKDGYLYSIHGQGGKAALQCVEIATGKVAWTGPNVGQGEVMLIDNKLVVQCADGKLILANADPKEFKEISNAKPISGQAWGWPAFSDGVFLYRTTTEVAALDLAAK